MKLLIIKSECRLSGDGIKKYEDEFNRMIREDGYLILPYGFKTEVVEVDCLDAFAPKLVTITNLNESCFSKYYDCSGCTAGKNCPRWSHYFGKEKK